MGKRFVFNDGDTAKFIGGVMIPPQDGRDVDEMFLEPTEGDGAGGGDAELEPERGDTALDNLREVLAGNVASVKAQLADFSDETLEQLAALEAEGANRSSLLAAIAAEQLKRAQDRTGGAPT